MLLADLDLDICTLLQGRCFATQAKSHLTLHLRTKAGGSRSSVAGHAVAAGFTTSSFLWTSKVDVFLRKFLSKVKLEMCLFRPFLEDVEVEAASRPHPIPQPTHLELRASTDRFL